VPPIAIRDLRLYNNEGELIHYWKMQQHNRDEVFDLIGGKRAVVENGVWYIDDFKMYRTYQVQLGGYNVFDFETNTVSDTEVTSIVQVYNVPFTLDKFRNLLQIRKLTRFKFMKLLETGEIPVDTGQKVIKLFEENG
jgi:hypothetical protein